MRSFCVITTRKTTTFPGVALLDVLRGSIGDLDDRGRFVLTDALERHYGAGLKRHYDAIASAQRCHAADDPPF